MEKKYKLFELFCFFFRRLIEIQTPAEHHSGGAAASKKMILHVTETSLREGRKF